MGATLATVAAITKEIYEPRLVEQLNDDVVALRRIEKTSDGVGHDVGGRYTVFPIHTRRNSGIGARNELEALPSAGQQGFNSGRIGLKYLYGRIQLSGQTIRLVDTNAQAFVTALDQEVQGVKEDLAKDCNRQVYGDGSGAVGVVATLGTGVSTVTVGSVLYFQQDMQVDVIDGTTLGNPTPTVKASNRQVTSINTTTNVATLSGAVFNSAVGDIVVRTGNANREWTGFGKMIANTGTLFNVDPTVEPLWKSAIDSNSGTLRALSEGLMINLADTIRTSGGYPTVGFCSLGVRRAYFNLLSQQRQYVNTKEFAGGFTGLAFTTDKGDIPIVADIDCPPNRVLWVNEKNIKVYRDADWGFMNMDGAMWNRVPGFDAYEATIFQYSELGTNRRNTHGMLSDIIEG